MTTSNTETNITVTYQDSDGTLDFVVDAAQPNITSLGTLTSLTVDDVFINGAQIGHTGDTDLITLSSGVVTVAGELDATSLDISGDADIDGTLEADAITIGGVTLAETISDTVGAMVTSNTETGVTVTYDDSDNTLDFVIGTLNQDTTGTAAIATTVTITDNESTNENNAVIFTAGGDVDGGNLGLESDGNLTYNPSSGTLTATAFAGALTGNVTGNASGTAATVTGAAQSNITSLGTLTTLTVDDITINGSTISDASDLTIDVGGDLILDAADSDIILKQDGTSYGQLTRSGNDFRIFNLISDGDLVFRGNDGGVNFTALTLDMSDAGTAIFNHDITLTDNGKAIFGTGSDLKIYHSSSDNNSYIEESGSGSLVIKADDLYIQNAAGTENMALFAEDGAVTLYHDNSAKIATTSTGATTTGLHTSTQSANITETALTDGTVAWDARAAANATLLLEENSTISAPSNAVAGAIISIEVAQHASSGPYTLAWNTVFEFAASTAPTMTATDAKTDIFSFRYNGSVWQEIGRVQNMAQT